MTVPRVVGGDDCGEVQVMDILDAAMKANLAKVIIFGCTEGGRVFRRCNGNELEAVGMLENAKFLYFVEDPED